MVSSLKGSRQLCYNIYLTYLQVPLWCLTTMGIPISIKIHGPDSVCNTWVQPQAKNQAVEPLPPQYYQYKWPECHSLLRHCSQSRLGMLDFVSFANLQFTNSASSHTFVFFSPVIRVNVHQCISICWIYADKIMSWDINPEKGCKDIGVNEVMVPVLQHKNTNPGYPGAMTKRGSWNESRHTN